MPLYCQLLSVGALTEVSEECWWCCVWWRWRRHGESQQVSHWFDVLLSKWLHGGSFRFQKIFQCALLEVRFCWLHCLYFSERHPILAGVSWGINLEIEKQTDLKHLVLGKPWCLQKCQVACRGHGSPARPRCCPPAGDGGLSGRNGGGSQLKPHNQEGEGLLSTVIAEEWSIIQSVKN